MKKRETLESIDLTLRGMLSLLVQHERDDGRAAADIALILTRLGMTHSEIAPLLSTTANAVRVMLQRARGKTSPQGPIRPEVASSGDA